MIIDSGDLKSRVAFSSYVCQFFWQTGRYHESWPDRFRAVVGFCSLQSLRAFGRSVFLESWHPTFFSMESIPVHDVRATHETRRFTRSGCLLEHAARQALSRGHSQQNISFHASRCERTTRLATIRGAWSSIDCHSGRIASRPGHWPWTQRAPLCDGLNNDRPVPVIISLGGLSIY